MKNITLKIDDETYRKARILAAGEGTSVSAMVRDFLIRNVAATDQGEDRHQRIVASLREIYAEAEAHARPRRDPFVPLTRDEIYGERLR